MGNTSKKDAIEAKALERDRQALDLRIAGATYEQIGDQLGYGSRQNARRAVLRRMEGLREECGEAAEEVRQQELMRLDAMLLGLWTRARKGDGQAIDRVLRIMDRRAAFLGIDSPRRTEHTGSDGAPIVFTFDEKFTDEQLRALAAADDPGEPGSAPASSARGIGEEGEAG